jgi:hypothetical protein
MHRQSLCQLCHSWQHQGHNLASPGVGSQRGVIHMVQHTLHQRGTATKTPPTEPLSSNL